MSNHTEYRVGTTDAAGLEKLLNEAADADWYPKYLEFVKSPFKPDTLAAIAVLARGKDLPSPPPASRCPKCGHQITSDFMWCQGGMFNCDHDLSGFEFVEHLFRRCRCGWNEIKPCKDETPEKSDEA
jgi:hypothetical protein